MYIFQSDGLLSSLIHEGFIGTKNYANLGMTRIAKILVLFYKGSKFMGIPIMRTKLATTN